MSDKIIEEAASIMGTHTCKEIIEGVWEHTFTPERTLDLAELISSEPHATAGQLSQADINALIEKMFDHAEPWPEFISVPIENVRRIRHAYRIGSLYRAHPVPRHKLRKCHMRRLQATWRKGKAHIARVEQAERGREDEAIAGLREHQE